MWRRWLGPFKEFGFAAGALYGLDRLLRSLSPACGLYVYELMVQPITNKAVLPANLAKNLSFALIERGHPDIERMPARAAIKASRFDQGACCLGAYRKGELIGYIWLCARRYDEDEVRCTYELEDADRSVFDFDLYVLPQHRLGLGFMAVWHGASSYLHAQGIRNTYSRLTRFNVISRRSHARLGGHRLGSAIFCKLWRVEWMISTVSPFVGMTFGDRRIRLRLQADAG